MHPLLELLVGSRNCWPTMRRPTDARTNPCRQSHAACSQSTINNTQTACEHLTQSRDRLRQALNHGANPAGRAKIGLLTKTAYEVMVTMARNRPLASVVGTALMGALLVRTKAWRWVPVSALLAALVPPLVKALAPREKM